LLFLASVGVWVLRGANMIEYLYPRKIRMFICMLMQLNQKTVRIAQMFVVHEPRN